MDKEKYEQLIKEVILPILKKEKSKRPKIFNSKKEPVNAILRLFELKPKNRSSSTDSSYNEINSLTSFSGDLEEFKMQNYTISQDLPKNLIKDDLNLNNNNTIFNVEFKGDTEEIAFFVINPFSN